MEPERTYTHSEVLQMMEQGAKYYYRTREQQTQRNRLWRNYKSSWRGWTGHGAYRPDRDGNAAQAEEIIESVVDELGGRTDHDAYVSLAAADARLAELVRSEPKKIFRMRE